ncbi:MAG: hypothetical protein KC466_00020 [Myxococcales bacterium]|nr:hypothetical protein [Myxococcales bacterium]
MEWQSWQQGFRGGPNPFGGPDFDLRPFLRPFAQLSPLKMVSTAVAIIVLSGVALSAFSALLVSLFFLMLLMEALLGSDIISAKAEPPR